MAPLTVMAVHAHPDDESVPTGGMLARYSDEGITTVLVTCTDGGCGDDPGGLKPGAPGFDRDATVARRAAELARSCEVLGVHHAESLGYADSGMMGWAQNHSPGSFWDAPPEESTSRLARLMELYRPQVVVTYDPNGFYGHPDHIQAHRVTMAAAESTGIPSKVYFTAVPRSDMRRFTRRLHELGVPLPGGEGTGSGPGPEDFEAWGTPDDMVTTHLDVAAVVDRKFESVLAHASQPDNHVLARMGRDVFGEIMGRESFVRALDRTGAPLPEDDLFAGLR